MQVTVIYKRMNSGRIRSTVSITDKGHYPTDLLFNNSADYPANDWYILKSIGGINFVFNDFDRAGDAIEWSGKQVQALEIQMKQWREVRIPSIEVYEI